MSRRPPGRTKRSRPESLESGATPPVSATPQTPASDMLELQRSAGNRAVQELIRGRDASQMSITPQFATDLTDAQLADQITLVQGRLSDTSPGRPEYETLRASLDILVSEQATRGGVAPQGVEVEPPLVRDTTLFATYLLRGGYIERTAGLLPPAWRSMSETELTNYLNERFTEAEIQAMYLEKYGERAALKARFRKFNIVAALVVGLVWARENIAEGEWGTVAAKLATAGGVAVIFNRLLYARDVSAEVLMARRAGEFGRWFQSAARTNVGVNFFARRLMATLLLWDVAQMFLMSGAGGGPNIPFDLITEIDIDDPSTWVEPDQTLLDFGFNQWYRQACTQAHPEACGPVPVYLAMVEGSAIRGIGKLLDIAPHTAEEFRDKLFRVEGDWDVIDLFIISYVRRRVSAEENILVITTGQRSGLMVSGRGHYRELEVRPANAAAIDLLGGIEPRYVPEYLLYKVETGG